MFDILNEISQQTKSLCLFFITKIRDQVTVCFSPLFRIRAIHSMGFFAQTRNTTRRIFAKECRCDIILCGHLQYMWKIQFQFGVHTHTATHTQRERERCAWRCFSILVKINCRKSLRIVPSIFRMFIFSVFCSYFLEGWFLCRSEIICEIAQKMLQRNTEVTEKIDKLDGKERKIEEQTEVLTTLTHIHLFSRVDFLPFSHFLRGSFIVLVFIISS